MKLRSLKLEDAAPMLEWMHDASVVSHMGTNFASKTEADCLRFIENSLTDTENVNLAIADEDDIYLGTVSLKHMDPQRREAEFAITIRACAMGKGVSRFAMESILEQGFSQWNLRRIYWCVSPENVRAVRFYDKNGYPRVDAGTLNTAHYTPEQVRTYLWYAITSEK